MHEAPFLLSLFIITTKGQIRFFYNVFHDPVGRSSERARSTHTVVKHFVKETNWSFHCDCGGSSLPLRVELCLLQLSISSLLLLINKLIVELRPSLERRPKLSHPFAPVHVVDLSKSVHQVSGQSTNLPSTPSVSFHVLQTCIRLWNKTNRKTFKNIRDQQTKALWQKRWTNFCQAGMPFSWQPPPQLKLCLRVIATCCHGKKLATAYFHNWQPQSGSTWSPWMKSLDGSS